MISHIQLTLVDAVFHLNPRHAGSQDRPEISLKCQSVKTCPNRSVISCMHVECV